ncbi:hypothetical protein SPRG_07788 [Saprolegnia parasitica CBS 223.65]|uniref:Uncharacterized protein n=1 Tax=Saprolegnia parasitica (strain CBS 223.65) TaxID=695850 RepID=A0A067C994_SAPPC|nr:hypothetical protein SPRG_07788 [Saprolegnia parasitica CBS 223.65]KDO27078.1 hypothetical protein SPRG_07788 [Saprolegnia parasitica CBS 223.65]|eukprot:XP_012202172.1 hypothetical protein SPRG_07788 [Saprolegnia parasitica CBS 223.65]
MVKKRRAGKARDGTSSKTKLDVQDLSGNQKQLALDTLTQQTNLDLVARVDELKRELHTVTLRAKRDVADKDLVISDLQLTIDKLENYISNLLTAQDDRGDDAANPLQQKYVWMASEAAKASAALSQKTREVDRLTRRHEAYEAQIGQLLTREHPMPLTIPDLERQHEQVRDGGDYGAWRIMVPLLLQLVTNATPLSPLHTQALDQLHHALKDSKQVPLFLSAKGLDCVCAAVTNAHHSDRTLLLAVKILWRTSFYTPAIASLRDASVFRALLHAIKSVPIASSTQLFGLTNQLFRATLPSPPHCTPSALGRKASRLEAVYLDSLGLLRHVVLPHIAAETPHLVSMTLQAMYKLLQLTPLCVLALAETPDFGASMLTSYLTAPETQLVVLRILHLYVLQHGVQAIPEAAKTNVDATYHALAHDSSLDKGAHAEVLSLLDTWRAYAYAPFKDAETPILDHLPILHTTASIAPRIRDKDALSCTEFPVATRLISLSASLPAL